MGEFSLHSVSVRIPAGDYVVVLGPTGAGKTVLLECIAGLLRPDSGEVWLDGENMTAEPPERRGIGYLPQDYALFPHLTVRDNMQFGLRVQRRDAEAAQAVADLAGMLGIGGLLDRYPATLSGGEKQRAALGRALAVRPRVMLLDEPLSALDASTRQQIGAELREIHDRVGITTVHVSHDFEETLRLADRVVLVDRGRIVQIGTPQELFRKPESLFAAHFVRGENIFEGTVRGRATESVVRIGDLDLACRTACRGAVHVMVRPEDLEPLAPEHAERAVNVIRGRIRRVEDRGSATALVTEGHPPITALLGRCAQRRVCLEPGREITLFVDPDRVHVFADETRDGTDRSTHALSGVHINSNRNATRRTEP
jgi:ABC-type Fe3+/spermidine/putrescine transport system ATPase subunit